jgi:hypothetical protein
MHIAAVGTGPSSDNPVPCFFLPVVVTSVFEPPALCFGTDARDGLLTSLGLLQAFDLFQSQLLLQTTTSTRLHQ